MREDGLFDCLESKRIVSFRRGTQNGSGTNPAFCVIATDIFPRSKSGRRVQMITWQRVAPRLRINRTALTPLHMTS